MSVPADMAKDLRRHHAICHELLAAVEREGTALRSPGFSAAAQEFHQLRKQIFPQLSESVERLKKHRAAWQQLSLPERSVHPEITSLFRLAQDVIMKILVLDRENEQLLLRQGLVPPAHLPSINRQRPHFVADLYRRSAS